MLLLLLLLSIRSLIAHLLFVLLHRSMLLPLLLLPHVLLLPLTAFVAAAALAAKLACALAGLFW